MQVASQSLSQSAGRGSGPTHTADLTSAGCEVKVIYTICKLVK